MPAAKFKFVVSSSDSLQGFEAENLLSDGRARTKWKGKAGVPMNSVILQMDREHQISSIDVGNESSALIEILVAKSCEYQPIYHTIVPSSSFMNPIESRSSKNCNRVRMFSSFDMIPAVSKQKWDLIKIICSQPFNTTIPYGIAFINVIAEEDETESKTAKDESESKNVLPKIKFKHNRFLQQSNSELIKAGDMFKQRHLYEQTASTVTSPVNSQKISSTKEHFNETDTKRNDIGAVGEGQNSKEHSKEVDEKHSNVTTLSADHQKFDRKEKKQQNPITDASNKEANNSFGPSTSVVKHSNNSDTRAEKNGAKRSRMEKNPKKATETKPTESQKNKADEKKAKIDATGSVKDSVTTATSTPSATKDVPLNQILSGVCFSLSGYKNPRRGELRTKACRMGALYEADWTPSCTHLICAFPNTPKWRQVGPSGIVVTDKWIDMCYMRKKRLPEKHFPLTLG